MGNIKVGITIGDINGVGPEIIIKSLANDRIISMFTPIIYGSAKVMAYHKNIVENSKFSFVSCSDAEQAEHGKINVINCWQDSVHINISEATKEGGQCAYSALDAATNDLKEGKIDAMVTAPINKHAMQLADFPCVGHTEYISDRLGEADQELMFMISDKIKVGVVTTHIPIADVAASITKERVLTYIKKINDSLKLDFDLEKPTIAVLGLNPHAGDNSAIGSEDESEIRPAIESAKDSGILASGPYSADAFFTGTNYQKFDAVLAMYHDQGLIPFKSLSFGEGVNFTAGLSVVRTSPDHGTAYDIAGQNRADFTSMRRALMAAIDIVRNRQNHADMTANPLKKSKQRSERR